jgi:phage pi2 protein 07
MMRVRISSESFDKIIPIKRLLTQRRIEYEVNIEHGGIYFYFNRNNSRTILGLSIITILSTILTVHIFHNHHLHLFGSYFSS